MASEIAIAAVVAKALVYCRRHQQHEVEAGIELWTEIFKDTPAEDLNAAVAQWAMNLDEDEIRAQVLPLPKTIQRILAGPKAPPDRTPLKVDAIASDEYKRLHVQAGRQIKLIAEPTASLDKARDKQLPPHNHEPPEYDDEGAVIFYGYEGCRRCNMPEDDGRRKRIAKIQAILDDLPTPDAEPSRPCRCDGSGILDEKESIQALTTLEYHPRFVYPCPKCNHDLFVRSRTQFNIKAAS